MFPPPSSAHPGKPHDETDGHEGDDKKRLHRLCEDGATQQEQTHAAEDDGRGDPRLVRAFEIGLAHAQDDQPQDGLEVECVPGYAVEGDERVEGADEDVNALSSIALMGVKKNPASGSANQVAQFFGSLLLFPVFAAFKRIARCALPSPIVPKMPGM